MADLTLPPAAEPIAKERGAISDFWFRKLKELLDRANGADPVPLHSILVADLPDAADYPHHMVYVSDESGGAQPAFSDGTNWRRCTDRAVVS